MILGYELPVDIPVMSMYDTDMMKAYLGALKADYEEGVKAEKEFMDKYGDFVSPIAGANLAYINAGVGQLDRAYDAIRGQGYDPIRSVAGRLMLRLAMRNVDRAKLATMKLSAENKKAYDKALASMTPELREYEKWRLAQQGVDLNNWDHNRLFDLTPEAYDPSYMESAVDAIPMQEKLIYHPDDADKPEDQRRVIGRESVRTANDVTKYVDAKLPIYYGTQLGKYMVEKAAQKYKDSNMNDNDAIEAAKREIRENLIARGVKQGKREIDPIYQFNTKREDDQKQFDREMSYKWASLNKRSGRGGGTSDDSYDLFDASDYNYLNDLGFEPYDVDDTSKHRIKVKDDAFSFNSDKGVYTIKEKDLDGKFFDENGNAQKRKSGKYGKSNDTVTLKPEGKIHTVKGSDGKLYHFIAVKGYVGAGVDAKGKTKVVPYFGGKVKYLSVDKATYNPNKKSNKKK